MNPFLLIAVMLAPAVDWDARTYDLSPVGPRAVKLVKGLWEAGAPVSERVTLRDRAVVDLNGDKQPEVVLLFEYWGGGQERNDLVQVYTPTPKGDYGRTAQLDGGWGKDGSLDGLKVERDRLLIGHDLRLDDQDFVVVRRYQLLPQGLIAEETVDFRAREPRKPGPDLAEQAKAARELLTKDPKAGAKAYLEIHAAANTPASLGDAAFALMKAQSPAAEDALSAAAFRASDGKQKGAAYYNLARFYLDNKQDDEALVAVRESLKERPDNAPTQKLLTLLQAGLGVRAIDWVNMKFKVDSAGPEIQLVNGEWTRETEDAAESLSLVQVTYGDVNGDKLEEALVHLNYWGGGTGRFDSLEVRDAKGAILGEIPGGDRADGGIADASIKDGAVHVSRMSSTPNGGACCPEYTVEEVWRWKAGKFEQDPTHTRLGSFADEGPDESTVPATLKEAEAAAAAKDTEGAIQLLLPILGTKKHAAPTYALFGFLLSQNDHWSAPPALQAALNAAPNEQAKAAIYYNLGRAYQRGAKYDPKNLPLAVAAFEASLKIRPGNTATEAALAEVKAAIVEAAKAKK